MGLVDGVPPLLGASLAARRRDDHPRNLPRRRDDDDDFDDGRHGGQDRDVRGHAPRSVDVASEVRRERTRSPRRRDGGSDRHGRRRSDSPPPASPPCGAWELGSASFRQLLTSSDDGHAVLSRSLRAELAAAIDDPIALLRHDFSSLRRRLVGLAEREEAILAGLGWLLSARSALLRWLLVRCWGTRFSTLSFLGRHGGIEPVGRFLHGVKLGPSLLHRPRLASPAIVLADVAPALSLGTMALQASARQSLASPCHLADVAQLSPGVACWLFSATHSGSLPDAARCRASESSASSTRLRWATDGSRLPLFASSTPYRRQCAASFSPLGVGSSDVASPASYWTALGQRGRGAVPALLPTPPPRKGRGGVPIAATRCSARLDRKKAKATPDAGLDVV
ncbi:hypothetical protein ZWY2020_011282 [Hordeum vulgare]|nr:hypothetical protein ZWY2020_011282 [Hordeum vulgare]